MLKTSCAAIGAALAIVCSLPAIAQTQTVPYSGSQPIVTGTLTTSGDYVPIDVSGGRWATVVWSVVGTAGTATITTEISLDGGTNWITSAYSKRLDVVSANPSVAPWAANTGVSGSVWEVPLPGNSTQFRLRCAGTGTTTNVRLYPGTPYIPGVPVPAILYDVTEGSIGAGVTAYVQDTSGWNSVMVMASSPTTQVWSTFTLDDAGVSIAGGSKSFTAASGGIAVFTRYGGDSSSVTIAASAINLYPGLSRRMQWSLPAGGTVSQGRLRVEASR